ncbi:MAG: hypothetical protein ACKVTZ_19280 [Bacteroidia bacterium]
MQINVKLTLLYLCLLLSFFSAKAQVSSKIHYNQLTYNFWLSKSWESLITKGEEALKENVDFYELRYRLGIAYYEKKNYIAASRHFKKAYQEKPDKYLEEYLFFCFIKSEKPEMAYFHTKKVKSLALQDSFKQYRTRLFNDIYFEVGTRAQINEQNLIGYSARLMLTQGIGNRLQIIHSATYAKQTYFRLPYQYIDYGLEAKFALANQLNLIGKGGIYRILSDYFFYDSTYSRFIAWEDDRLGAWGSVGLQYQNFRLTVNPYVVFSPHNYIWEQNKNNIEKTDTNYSFNVYQAGIQAAYLLPFWKNRIKIGGDISYYGSNLYNNDVITKVFAEVDATPKLKISGSYLFSNSHNVFDMGTNTFYSSLVKTRYLANLVVTYKISPKNKLYLSASYDKREDNQVARIFNSYGVFLGIEAKF